MTRDSWLFSWLTVAISIAGYLALGPSPATWDWPHWMQAIVAIGGIILSKLGTSPLESKAEQNSVNRGGK